MKIAAFFASPRAEGISNSALSYFLSFFKEAEISFFRPYEMAVFPCTDCKGCLKPPHECVIRDDMDLVYKKALKADLIAVACPIYYGAPPAPMKAVMDRTMCLYSRFFLSGKVLPKKDKKAVLIASCGDDDRELKDSFKHQLKMFFDCLRAEVISDYFVTNTDNSVSINKQTIEKMAIDVKNRV